jgi:hypothetical protein
VIISHLVTSNWVTLPLLATRQDNSLPAAIRPVDDDDELPLLANHVNLPFEKDGTGFYYMGGVDGGRGLGVFI